jgi:hypothetical protein
MPVMLGLCRSFLFSPWTFYLQVTGLQLIVRRVMVRAVNIGRLLSLKGVIIKQEFVYQCRSLIREYNKILVDLQEVVTLHLI